ncbi:hypothetical protein [Aurantimonas sp. Leaf443]|uniref:hypothetical protein n=1 Tax=Aurantimonas sp. Leaf443 TaxID=1736378 RepID=UPI0006FE654F|nr:hypothetical protein [Aurantimonas sp. Leaf443]KQT83120.1 hypothetical protein ASG48_14200 [Aurantimonas sp. Leaf443]
MMIHLCQDCLAVAKLPRYEEEAPCEWCGGDLCGCKSCVQTADALLAGVRSRAALGLQRPEAGDLRYWCEATGVRGPIIWQDVTRQMRRRDVRLGGLLAEVQIDGILWTASVEDRDIVPGFFWEVKNPLDPDNGGDGGIVSSLKAGQWAAEIAIAKEARAA